MKSLAIFTLKKIANNLIANASSSHLQLWRLHTPDTHEKIMFFASIKLLASINA